MIYIYTEHSFTFDSTTEMNFEIRTSEFNTLVELVNNVSRAGSERIRRLLTAVVEGKDPALKDSWEARGGNCLITVVTDMGSAS